MWTVAFLHLVKYFSQFLFLDRSKAEMDLKELSESVQQQSTPVPLISPKRQIRSRFQLNLDKTIESCKAQLGEYPKNTVETWSTHLRECCVGVKKKKNFKY